MATGRGRNTGRAPGAPVRDGGALLALAGFIMGVAILTVLASVHLLRTGESELTQTTSTDTALVDYLKDRDRTIAWVGSQPPDVHPDVLLDGLRSYLARSFATSAARSVDVNATLAKAGTLDGDGRAASEAAYTGGGVYTVRAVNDVDFTTTPYDGTDDGLIRDGNGRIVGALIRLQATTPTSRLVEILPIGLKGST